MRRWRGGAGRSWRGCALAVALLAAAAIGVAGCRQEARFAGSRAYQDVVAQCELGPRLPGSEASAKARDYFCNEFRDAGWAVEEQPFEYDGVALANVVAKRGSGPLVVLGAHYDSRALADGSTQPVPGANDGASGAAVLLELARSLDADKLSNEVWLVLFDAEDQGRLNGWPWSVGARYLADNLTDQPECVIVVDMVGDEDQQIYWERSSTTWLNEAVWSTADSLGYASNFVPEAKYQILDDHTPFLERGIPAVDLIDFDYPYWHTTQDTPDRVSAASLERVGQVLEHLLEHGPLEPPNS